ncbi:HNH endonuclease [Rhodopseudomonas sp. B29]|uniref:HNH endonuclease n=1 Tax=Rhodopseudomonas sp. B29 TaxID=95607 RepID=UPI0011D26E6A|nr:HNH endonuclease signature motif containing protein [Rhodopseudomonas sp. B29]
MKNLSLPEVDFSTALAEAIAGISDAATRQVYTAAFDAPQEIEANYVACARAANLYAQPRVATTEDPVICGSLRKSDLTKLYTQYFVPEGKPARRLYEALKVSAGGKCPLCGGVGHVRNLDHYLPKANFPLYSVLPVNLIPCCRDCNTEKLNEFANVRENQTLHPYFDNERFFVEQWVHARVIPSEPPVLEYYVHPPDEWERDDKLRVEAHFLEYGLAGKFSIEAAADLPETIQTRRTTMSANSSEDFSHYLAEKGKTPTLPVNNWRRVMFSALALDRWFCSHTFP